MSNSTIISTEKLVNVQFRVNFSNTTVSWYWKYTVSVLFETDEIELTEG